MNDDKFVLVDSYGVTDEFFDACANLGLKVGYIDDLYTFETGSLSDPVKRNVRVLINYSFGFSKEDYEKAYKGTSTKLLIGPKYVPIREVFKEKANRYQVRDKVENILITTGFTNPNNSLEKMARGCRDALPNAHISVVVGSNAGFNSQLVQELDLALITNVTDLSDYMLASDLVISAAGTTLYELCALGVPTIAVPVVENQLVNARGFQKERCGYALITIAWNNDDIAKLIREIVSKRSNNQYRASTMRDASKSR